MVSELETFRTETRAWLEANCPAGARGAGPISIGSRSLDLGDDVSVSAIKAGLDQFIGPRDIRFGEQRLLELAVAE